MLSEQAKEQLDEFLSTEVTIQMPNYENGNKPPYYVPMKMTFGQLVKDVLEIFTYDALDNGGSGIEELKKALTLIKSNRFNPKDTQHQLSFYRGVSGIGIMIDRCDCDMEEHDSYPEDLQAYKQAMADAAKHNKPILERLQNGLVEFSAGASMASTYNEMMQEISADDDKRTEESQEKMKAAMERRRSVDGGGGGSLKA